MLFNLDKRFIQILNERGHKITWDQFRAAYNVRKSERELDPDTIARKRRSALLSDQQARLEALYVDHLEP